MKGPFTLNVTSQKWKRGGEEHKPELRRAMDISLHAESVVLVSRFCAPGLSKVDEKQLAAVEWAKEKHEPQTHRLNFGIMEGSVIFFPSWLATELKAFFVPPQSAMFSPDIEKKENSNKCSSVPCVSLPFTKTPGITSKVLYWSMMHWTCSWVRVSESSRNAQKSMNTFFKNFSLVAFAHQSSNLPSPLYSLPWSSKPCVNSWPITKNKRKRNASGQYTYLDWL